MFVRNKIWDEIGHAKSNAICAYRYANVQRRIQLCYRISIPFLTGLCALFAKLEFGNAVFWTAIITFVSSLLKSVFTNIILSEKDILELDKLYEFFSNHLTKVEDLMMRYDNPENKMTDEQAHNHLESLLKVSNTKMSQLNKLVLWIPFWVDKSITKECDNYLNQIHYNKYE